MNIWTQLNKKQIAIRLNLDNAVLFVFLVYPLFLFTFHHLVISTKISTFIYWVIYKYIG